MIWKYFYDTIVESRQISRTCIRYIGYLVYRLWEVSTSLATKFEAHFLSEVFSVPTLLTTSKVMK